MKSLFLLSCFLVSAVAASAADYTCRVEHFRDRETVKASAKICGEFRFSTEGTSPKKESFKDCSGAEAEFIRQGTSSGNIFVLKVSQGGAGAAQLMAKALPAEFELISSRPLPNKKHSLSEEYFLDCKQAQ